MSLNKKQFEDLKLLDRIETLENEAWSKYQDIHGFGVAFEALSSELQKEFRKLYKAYYKTECPY